MTENRDSAAKRGYDNKWVKASKAWLKKHPFCAMHEERGRTVLATLVDHIIPHRGDMKLFWDKTNWQGLCDHCHNSHKKRLEMSGGVVGCSEDGIPLATAHHWHKKADKGGGG